MVSNAGMSQPVNITWLSLYFFPLWQKKKKVVAQEMGFFLKYNDL
jgi:hypothetical protein